MADFARISFQKAVRGTPKENKKQCFTFFFIYDII